MDIIFFIFEGDLDGIRKRGKEANFLGGKCWRTSGLPGKAFTTVDKMMVFVLVMVRKMVRKMVMELE